MPIQLDLYISIYSSKKKKIEKRKKKKKKNSTNESSTRKQKWTRSRSGGNKMMGRGHGGESKINVASTTFVPGHRTPQLLWLSGFADTRKLQTWPGSTPRGQQIRMVSAKVQVQWQHRRTEKLYHQWNIRCRPASAEDLSNGNWFRFERGRRGRRALILEGAGSSSWFALEFVRLQHGPPVSTQINWDPLCRSKDTSLMFYSARFRNVWRIARTFNINAQRNSNWNLAFF